MRPAQSTATCIFLVSLPVESNTITSTIFLGIRYRMQINVTLHHWMYSVISQSFYTLTVGGKASTPIQEKHDA